MKLKISASLSVIVLILFAGCTVTNVYVHKSDEILPSYYKIIAKTGVLDEGEQIAFMYCDAFDLKNRFYLATDKRLVIYRRKGDPERIYIPYCDISGIHIDYDDSFFVDSSILIHTKNGEQYVFPVSSARGRDKVVSKHLKLAMAVCQ